MLNTKPCSLLGADRGQQHTGLHPLTASLEPRGAAAPFLLRFVFQKPVLISAWARQKSQLDSGQMQSSQKEKRASVIITYKLNVFGEPLRETRHCHDDGSAEVIFQAHLRGEEMLP